MSTVSKWTECKGKVEEYLEFNNGQLAKLTKVITWDPNTDPFQLNLMSTPKDILEQALAVQTNKELWGKFAKECRKQITVSYKRLYRRLIDGIIEEREEVTIIEASSDGTAEKHIFDSPCT